MKRKKVKNFWDLEMEDSTFLELVKQFFLSPGGFFFSFTAFKFRREERIPKKQNGAFSFFGWEISEYWGGIEKNKTWVWAEVWSPNYFNVM